MSAHKWEKPVIADPLELFGKSARKKVKALLGVVGASSVRADIAHLDDDFLSWFVPMYTARISEKDNPKLFDVKSTTIDTDTKQYFSLSLFEDEKPIGGTIFSMSNNRLSFVYRTYNFKWHDDDLPANPTLYAEYLVCRYAFEGEKEVIVHGKDRNPYGINSGIGLAIFKLSVGCKAYKSKSFELSELNIENLNVDTLILEYPGDDSDYIRKAHLVVLPENEQKYIQVTKYPKQLEVEVHYRKK